MTTAVAQDRRVDTLVGLLDELAVGQRELLVAVESKIAAMRSGDPEAIRDATLKEQAIVRHMSEREDLRRQLTINIARGYGVGAPAARRMSASQLADRIGSTGGARIRKAAAALKDVTTEVAQRNHVAQLIAQNVLRHMKLAFQSMTSGMTASLGYGHSGQTYTGVGERIFDAVG
ncbi:MAG: flagellar protein FlgN [Phycisphaerales bacterium]|nr:flagellar protein FlgN [Phycisphaerales bacterium]